MFLIKSRQDEEGGMDHMSMPSCVTTEQNGKQVPVLKLLMYVNLVEEKKKERFSLSWDVYSTCVGGRHMY